METKTKKSKKTSLFGGIAYSLLGVSSGGSLGIGVLSLLISIKHLNPAQLSYVLTLIVLAGWIVVGLLITGVVFLFLYKRELRLASGTKSA